jgi:hypothetical protein
MIHSLTLFGGTVALGLLMFAIIVATSKVQ